MIVTRSLFQVLSVVILPAVLFGRAESGDVFRVRHSDEQLITLDFALSDVEIVEQVVGGETYQLIGGGGAISEGEPGYPQMEMFSFLIGIPRGGDVEGVLVPGKTEVVSGLKLLPVGGIDHPEALAYSDVYLEGGEYPAQNMEVGEPGFLRRQQVVRVKVFPFQVDPPTGDVRVIRHGRIELRIKGGDGGTSDVPAADGIFEGVYRSVLLNNDVAMKWRSAPVHAGIRHPSPFFEGERWLKVLISDEGIYYISYNDIFNAGISPSTIDPATIQLFYGGGKELPWSVTDPRPELKEVAVELDDGGDGSLDPGDEIIFYGQSLLRWDGEGNYLRHRYDSNNCYWLTWGNPDATPRRMTVLDGTPVGPGEEVRYYRDNRHVEQDHIFATEEFVYERTVPDDWVWENISGTSGEPVTRSYNFQMDETYNGGSDSLRLEVYGQPSTGSHFIELKLNGVDIGDISFSGGSRYDTEWFSLPDDLLTAGSNTLTLYLPRNTSSTSDDAIYMGWFDINAVYSLDNVGSDIIFRGQPGGGVTRYRLGGASAATPRLYRITDPFTPSRITGFSEDGDVITFELEGTGLSDRYALLDRGGMRRPQSIAVVDDLTLRSTSNGADYVIITSPDLEGVARDMAMYRASRNGMVTMAVTSDRIFNECSWGVLDVTAFRDFLKYAYEDWDISPSMVLFLGDGHYDYKGFTSAGRNKVNPLPPHISNDLVIEDWFVRFDNNANPEMIYGRLPVQTPQEARIATQKVLDYEENPEYGSWKSRVVLVADDYYTAARNCEGLEHTEQTEQVDIRLPSEIERVKIYLLEYPFDPPETGLEKPAVTEDIIKEWNRGALIINYVGHGSYRTWSHEKAFHMPDDFPKLDNGARLPMTIAASCENGRFDDPAFDSMIEDLLKTPGKGIIASFSATRATFSSPNRTVNNDLIEELFSDSAGTPYLGEAVMNAKIRAGGSNSYRYTLFGDPATRLSYPGLGVSFTDSPDSLRPLGQDNLSGEILVDGAVDETVEGFAEVRIFDPPIRKTYSECPQSQTFMTAGNSLFNGVASVNAGVFSTSFIVPANVPASLPPDTTAMNNARIYTYLSWDGGDGSGAVDSIPLSLSAAALGDSISPSITLTRNGKELVSDDGVSIGGEILVGIFDENGVNVTGSPGHQIVSEIDGGALREDLTEGFRYDVDSFKNGTVKFIVPDLTPGKHLFGFRASDNALNISYVEVSLDVYAASETGLSQVLFYPNPYHPSRTGYFTFEVSRPSQMSIRIYTVAGRLIRRIDRSVGHGYNQIEWYGRDWRGDTPADGVYLCHVLARSALEGSGSMREDEQLVKLLLVR